MVEIQFKESEEILKDIENLTQEVEKLRRSYDQYFLGLQKDPPEKQRALVLNLIRKLSGVVIRNAAIKFRLQQTLAKYNTYSPYWDQILRQIEEGTYKRHLFRASLKEREKQTTPKEPSKTPPLPSTTSPSDPIAKLFEQYVQARKNCKEGISGLTIENFRKTIQTQVENIQKKNQGVNVRFQIIVDQGKAKIRATAQPKKT